MNWFERYGIVGMFFFVMTGMWFFCLFPEAHKLFSEINKTNPELLKFIGGFCGLSILPFGYIIMVCSQVWYYSRGNKRDHISCKLWVDLDSSNEQQNKILLEKIIGGFNPTDEAQVEAVFTYYDRRYFPPKTNKLISSFISKRFDTIAINRGLILAIFLSLIAAICIAWVILNITFWLPAWFVIIFAGLIVWVLGSSKRILEGQIFEVAKRKQKDMVAEMHNIYKSKLSEGVMKDEKED